MNHGVYTADTELVRSSDDDFDEIFSTAYDYMSNALSAICAPPEGVRYPIWAHHFPEGCVHDIGGIFFWVGDDDYADDPLLIFTLDIDDQLMVESHYGNYHCILNNGPCINSAVLAHHYPDVKNPEDFNSYTDKQWDDLYEIYSADDTLMKENWDATVFDVSGEEYTQVCFWEIRQENIMSIYPVNYTKELIAQREREFDQEDIVSAQQARDDMEKIPWEHVETYLQDTETH